MKKKLNLFRNKIPVNTPKIFKQEKKYVLDCMKSGWISSQGKYVDLFEKKFSIYNNRRYGVAVSNGTAALEIALKALNLKKNDEVIIPTFTIISSILCIIKLGLKPVLVDSDLETWNMSVSKTLAKITKKTKVIILTHIYGYPIDMEKLLQVSKKKKIKIIEDAAEMIGQKYKGRKCGSYGDISTFSFYANKHITTGEGGMVLTNDKKIFKKIKSLRNLCFGSENNRFDHDDIGYNYRLTNIQAAIGCGQLKNINWIIKKKIHVGKLYFKLLKNNKNLLIQRPKIKHLSNIYWVFGIILKNYKKKIIMKKLLDAKIETRSFFKPMHMQTIIKKLKIFKNKEKFPISEYMYKNGFYLPSGVGINDKQIKFVARFINKILI